MARLIPTAERITRARALIEKARKVPPPEGLGWQDFTYVAQVKDILQQARDLIKFISYNPAVSAEVKAEVTQLFIDIDQAQKEILHR